MKPDTSKLDSMKHGKIGNKGKSFVWWQWRIIIVTMAGYALYYLLRKNFALAMPGLMADYGITKVQLGIFLTLNGIVYGLSRFVNGILTDRGSARVIMCTGLLLSAIVNLLFACSDHFAGYVVEFASRHGMTLTVTSMMVLFMGILWVINGYLQGMGVPPCTKTMTQWIHPDELATKMSVWNMSHSIGAGLVFALCGWFIMPHLGIDVSGSADKVAAIAANIGADISDPKVLEFARHFCAWRWCFIIPAAICLVGVVWLFFSLKDSPSDAGFEEISGRKAVVRTPEESAEYKAFIRKKVFGNRVIWTLALTNFFVYVIRFAALDWGPVLLMESKGLTLATATTLCFVFEIIGGNIGMLFWGWLTDRFFASKAHHTCVICMAGAALCIALFFFIPASSPWWVMMIPFTLLGFCIYGPQALLGICAANHATNRASATANGILGIFGYASSIISGVGFGYVTQHYGWDSAYLTIFITALLGALTLLTIWTSGANGYEKQQA